MADAEDEKPRNPHDRLARRILSNPEAAGVELRHVLPERLARQLDFGDVRIEPESFIDPRLKEGRSDILYSIAFRGSDRRALIYVLLEHQSTPDPLMPWRMLQYLLWIWQRYLAAHPDRPHKLPLIIPVVLAQCEHGWTAPSRLSELFDLPDEIAEDFVSPVELTLTIDEVDEAIEPDPHARPEVLALVRLMRWLMAAHHHGDRFTEDQIITMTALFRTVNHGLGVEASCTLWYYVVSAFEPGSRFRRILLDGIDEEQRGMHDSMMRKWLAEGGREWLAEHEEEVLELVRQEEREEGRKEGRAAARAEMLLELLAQRGLAVSSTLRACVLETTDEVRLQHWFQRAITADSIEAVFGRVR
ncbi:Rpn family recombination-promoting nuclease/putative transposase [Paraliomyxa miuraensis]|uniref:Rpn family recombination-promoting nuclease/putative transposase n=1 Tax=Paraliomyxa miuraensis TaxID=376150 RepID=UPI00225A6E81|nr:Rpn family recombination-promoting nuclease/putative transposase [Paraliomyxa miuraensis]MCX4244434.1 Rpn family recombination-promoting nuclease/putative transposase [Paraliomyxa miuraensis]